MLTLIKQRKIETTRIAILAILLILFLFHYLSPFIFLLGVILSIFGLTKEGILGLLKHRKIGTEIYITLAVGVAVFGKEYLAAGIILLIILIAEFIGDVMDEQARTSIKSLVDEVPRKARVKSGDGKENLVKIENLKIGDTVLVKVGEKIPVDGVVTYGSGAINQAAITGENMPQEKSQGDEVYAGTILQTGALNIRVTKLSNDTLFAHIITLVNEAQERRANIEKLTDKISAYLIPISFLFIIIVYLLTRDVRTVIALFIFTSPAELGLATPLVMIAGVARAACEGILLKGGIFLEEMARIDAVVFDKTGTLTIGKPVVTNVEVMDNAYSKEEIISLAATADRRSSHPLAQAIIEYAKRKNVSIGEPSLFETVRGRGVKAIVNSKTIELGNDILLKDNNISLPKLDFGTANSTVIFLLVDGNLTALIYLSDILREGAKKAIKALSKDGIQRIIMLTGDNLATAKFVAQEAGINDYRAGLLPEDKISVIKEIQSKEGMRVAMVGDGINDAPALAQANIGIAMGIMGNQAAMDAADVVLLGDDLKKVAKVRILSRRAYKTIKENIFLGVWVVHIVGIILVVTKVIGPIEAAAIHLVPDILVFLNSTKLLKVKID